MRAARANQRLAAGRLVSLIGPTYEADVGYGMDANLYGGGFNHFVIEVVRAQDWKARSKVQLWVKGAEAGMGTEPFKLIKLGGRRSDAAVKAAATRKRRAAGAKAAQTRKRRAAGRKVAATHKAKQA